MARINEFTFLSSNGIDRIHAVEWLPEKEKPRAVLQLAHGIEMCIRDRHDITRSMRCIPLFMNAAQNRFRTNVRNLFYFRTIG